jgi:hypothetical protein
MSVAVQGHAVPPFRTSREADAVVRAPICQRNFASFVRLAGRRAPLLGGAGALAEKCHAGLARRC